MRRLLAFISIVLTFVLPAFAFALEAEETPEPVSRGELSEEVERQLSELDLSALDEYADMLGEISDADSVPELVAFYAEGGGSGESVLWDAAKALFSKELKASLGAMTALVGAAVLTSLSGMIGGEGLKPVLSLILCGAAAAITAGIFASLLAEAGSAIAKTGELTEKAAPILSTLLVSLGAPSTAGLFRPMLVFLSGTVMKVIESVILPLVSLGGVLCVADALTGGSRLSELSGLIKRLAKWLLGLLSAFYFGMTAVRGLTLSMYDGVTLRTAKYAIDRLVPVVGGMVSGTVDSVMGCALLIKNGIGCVTVIILVALTLRPLAVLLAGSFIFRAASALSQPAADQRVIKLFSGAADMASLLFACAAASCCMLLLTLLVFIASGGITAGLW